MSDPHGGTEQDTCMRGVSPVTTFDTREIMDTKSDPAMFAASGVLAGTVKESDVPESPTRLAAQCAICGSFIADPYPDERWIKCKRCGTEWENASYEGTPNPGCRRCHGKGYVPDTHSPDFIRCRCAAVLSALDKEEGR
jgi:uncharacterized paraquat-inducible protein A